MRELCEHERLVLASERIRTAQKWLDGQIGLLAGHDQNLLKGSVTLLRRAIELIENKSDDAI